MLLKIVISLVVFAVVFYFTQLLCPFLQAIFQHWQKKKLKKITPKLDRMFLDVPLNKLILIDTLSPLLTGLLGFMLSHSLWFSLGAAVMGLTIPLLVVKRLEIIRRQKFVAQLVDGILIISSSLKAGLSLLQAFEALVEEMPAPISQEFSLVIRQMRMGVLLEEAFAALKKRMQVDELDMVITSMLVSRETGGDLTETFSRLIYTIQERSKIIGRVRALCIQGKLQGAIMSVLPILFGIFVYKMNPNFFDVFLKDNLGKGLLIYAVFSEIIGTFFIHRFSRVDI